MVVLGMYEDQLAEDQPRRQGDAAEHESAVTG
jgi:hypothetical protein